MRLDMRTLFTVEDGVTENSKFLASAVKLRERDVIVTYMVTDHQTFLDFQKICYLNVALYDQSGQLVIDYEIPVKFSHVAEMELDWEDTKHHFVKVGVCFKRLDIA